LNTDTRLGDGFFRKLASSISAAKTEIEAKRTADLVYLVVVWDDIALDYYRQYRRDVISFCREHAISDVHVKVGLRFNRRVRIKGVAPDGRLTTG